jgi:hypothetical protein
MTRHHPAARRRRPCHDASRPLEIEHISVISDEGARSCRRGVARTCAQAAPEEAAELKNLFICAPTDLGRQRPNTSVGCAALFLACGLPV